MPLQDEQLFAALHAEHPGPVITTHRRQMKAAGVNPQVIVDVLKLLTDLKNQAGFAVILQDIRNLIADLTLAQPKEEIEKAKPEPGGGGCCSDAHEAVHWSLAA